jgi:hypothetical protein
LADRPTELLVTTPLLAVEVGGYFAPDETLVADIDGDGDEVDVLMPFVWIPGGMGRLTLLCTVCAAVAEGAIFGATHSAGQSTYASATKPTVFLCYRLLRFGLSIKCDCDDKNCCA